MSNLLEQAIIDAKALKETAEKQAQKSILEKYQEEIKSVYDSMLEQDVDPLQTFASEKSAEREDPSLDFEDDLDLGGDDSMAPQMPFAHEEGENLCPCPEEDEEIEIDFDKLSAMLSGETSQETPADDMLSGGMGGLGGDEDMEDFANLKLEEDELPENNKFSFQSKAMGTDPSDKLKNISPNVKDKDVKRSAKDVVDIDVDGDSKLEIDEASGMVGTNYGGDLRTSNRGGKGKSIGPANAERGDIDVMGRNVSQQKKASADNYYNPSAKSPQNKKGPSKRVPGSNKYVGSPGDFDSGKYTGVNKNPSFKINEADSELCEVCYEVHAPGSCSKDMQEKVIFNDKGNKSGWTARPTDVLAHELDKNETDEMYDKDDSDSFKDADYKKDLEDKETEYDNLEEYNQKLKEKFKEIYKENLNLKEKNNSYVLKVAQLSEKNYTFISLLEKAQKELERTHLQSTKLFYENKVFRNASLNERQKSNIVEAISEINTAEQVRPIYEALLKNKGAITSNQKGSSKSLKEAIGKRSGVTRLAVSSESRTEPKEQSTNLNPLMERMQKLAGIKKE